MRIDPAIIEDVKRRTDLVGLIGGATVLRRTGSTFTGPCPFCGGSKKATRFEVKPAQQAWVCAACRKGGDAIAFVMEHEGLGFLEAIEALGGPRPLSDEARRKLAQQAQAREREAAKRDEKQMARARQIWDEGVAPAGSLIETYFAHRGIPVAPGETLQGLRFHPALEYWWNPPAAAPYLIHTGPAMLGGIVSNDGQLLGVHCTYLHDNGSKLVLPDRDNETPPAKKVRGKASGGAIHLSPPAPLLVIGEGIETTRAVQLPVRRAGREAAFWSGVSLGNIAGASLGKGMPHPDKPGVWIPGEAPDPERPGLVMPDWAEEVLLLGDGDSDPMFTRARLNCAAWRIHETGRKVRIAWADAGLDFNDMVRG